MADEVNMSKTVGPIDDLEGDPVIAENIRLKKALDIATENFNGLFRAAGTIEVRRDMWKARAKAAEAFIADFAAFTFTEAQRPHIRDPQDEPDEYVDAQEVWLWQSDAKDLLK